MFLGRGSTPWPGRSDVRAGLAGRLTSKADCRASRRSCAPCAASLFEPRGELGDRRFLREASGSGADVRWNPIGEEHFFRHVTSRARVDLAHLRKAIRWKPIGRSEKGRPQPPMDEGDLTLDEATYEDLVTVTDGSRHREDLVTFRMRPPATPNRSSGYGLSKRRDRPSCGFQDDTVLANESESLE